MNFALIGTELGIAVLLLAVLVLDLLLPPENKRRLLGLLTLSVLALLLLYTLSCLQPGEGHFFYQNFYLVDNYSLLFKAIFITGELFTVLFSLDYAEKLFTARGEFYALLLSSLLGMCMMASAMDFLTVFAGLELMTIACYILAGLQLRRNDSSEAAVKYLIIGACSTAVFLYGISLVYGSTGSLYFTELSLHPRLFCLGLIGLGMVIIGFLFKLAIIPFHMWAPDVYQGAPAPVTALLAMCSKGAGIAALVRVLYIAFPQLQSYWLPLLLALAAVCMIGGNVMAIRQDNLKRMLAYSSIAQAGYMLSAIISADPAGVKAVIFYAALYVFANAGAFAVISYLECTRGNADHADITGLAQSSPLLAAVMTISLLSMAGIPPTAGFAGKLYIFSAVIEQGHLWLAFIGFVMSMISVYYYLMVTKEMYRDLQRGEESRAERLSPPPLIKVAAAAAAAITILIGISPEYLARLTNLAAQSFIK